MHVLGRSDDGPANRPTGRIGRFLARDGSRGATVGVDLDRPHAGLVVGKRGSGKSHTLGVVVEEATRVDGLAPVVVDPMGALTGLAADSDGPPVPARVAESPCVRADALTPSQWPALFDLDPAGSVGSLLWRAATEEATLSGMLSHVADADAHEATCRGARNHLRMADSWGVFDPAGLAPVELADDAATVLSLAELAPAAAEAVCAAVAGGLYAAAVDGRLPRLPWLFVDEGHVFFDGVADAPLRRLFTRGRAPGVGLVVATQRPGALPSVAVSQADLTVAHRLTAASDLEALTAASPAYLEGTVRERLPETVGRALVVDDATERAHRVAVRERATPHEGETPRASARAGREN
ncbi:MAG: ATP-binding protein [Halolamina sp.]